MFVHRGNPPLGFFFIIQALHTEVKTFIFSEYPPGGLAKVAKNRYNTGNFAKEAEAVSQSHEHDSVHGHVYFHAHGTAHTHGHVHENQKAVVNRLSRAIGHLEKVKRMVEEGYDCSEVLVQLAAVRSALDNTGKVILKDHMRHCMVDAVSAGDTEAIDDLCSAIDKFMK
nr:metal-sensing transcriptional repressor [Oscillospiraceae bacterium]